MSVTLRWLLSAAVTLVLVYVLLVVLAWKLQDRLAFPAPRSALPLPSSLGIFDGRTVSVTAADSVVLRGWYLPPHPAPDKAERAPAIIWFYGNMETVEGVAPSLHRFRPPGMGLLVLDYRGYGTSDGQASEAGVYLDSEAAWEYLLSRPEIDSARIGVYGRSIGSAVALHLATERPVRALVLDSPLSNAREMARLHYRFLPTFMARLVLDNLSRAERLTIPLIVFHGTEDRITPIDMGRRVAELGRAEEIIEIPGAGHNDTHYVGGDAYVARFHEFWNTHLRGDRSAAEAPE
jgi:pimeloyl-ACP methyl ester carboxylesterase